MRIILSSDAIVGDLVLVNFKRSVCWLLLNMSADLITHLPLFGGLHRHVGHGRNELGQEGQLRALAIMKPSTLTYSIVGCHKVTSDWTSNNGPLEL